MTALLTDHMLGRLTTYLRMCGYDTVYAGDRNLDTDEAISSCARDESRVLLTRSRKLARRTDDAILLESRDIRAMLSTLSERGFELTLPETPGYCSSCNGSLEGVPPDDRTPDYAPDPVSVAVWRCTQCGQFFWKGTHWDDVAETLAAVSECR